MYVRKSNESLQEIVEYLYKLVKWTNTTVLCMLIIVLNSYIESFSIYTDISISILIICMWKLSF